MALISRESGVTHLLHGAAKATLTLHVEDLPSLVLAEVVTRAAGLERRCFGKGKGAATGGAHIAYDIVSGHIGALNSQAMVQLQWRHVIGQEGPCLY